ncbi:acyltransferase family protein [Kytococcus sedentarius]|uniref:acyltransferase family protein n=1 Tax=Kytococcus sedentarius TaxID=1276 RepID=UPI0035BBD930
MSPEHSETTGRRPTPTAGGFGSGPADSGRIQGLDGLRALAVGLVVVYHLLPDRLPGGFIGVDVFFVISGFLITTLLLREVRRNGYMNMPTFWMRRIRRLLPALVLVLLVCTALVWIVDVTRGGDLRVGLGRQILGGLTFTTNWVEIANGTSYFDQNQPVLYKPLWSLAVEEQFYLLWPPALALMLVLSARWRGRMLMVMGLGVGSAVWMAVLYFTADDVTRPYYGTDSHLFGLMAGVLLSFWWMSRGSWLRSAAWRQWRGPAGLVALVGVLLLSLVMPEDRAVTYLGGLFVASVLTTVVIASLLPGRTWLHGLLELRPMEWVGERSYGLYLWHWPVLLLMLAALPAQEEGSLGYWTLRLVAVVITVLVAEASYRWVETPIRRQGFRSWALGVVDAVRRGETNGSRVPVAPARVAAGGAALALLMGGVAVATAPEKTETQLAIEANEEALAELEPELPVPPSSGASPDGPGRSPSSSGSASGSGTPTGGSSEPTSEPSASSDPEKSGPSASAQPSGSGSEPEPTASSGGPSGPASEEPEESVSSGGDDSGWYVPKGDQVTVFGDSLVVSSLYGFRDKFPGVQLVAKSNRQWPEGRALVRAHLEAGAVRDSVVMSYGTNAGVREPEIVREALDLLGPDRQVVLVNLYGKSSWIEESNANLQEIADDYPNVAVADWHSMASQNPGYLQSDGVHPDIEGANAYAQLVKDTFAAQAGE